jgi:serine protease Do
MRSFVTSALAGLIFGFTAFPAVAQVRELPDFSDLVEHVGPAVVNIRTTQKIRGGSMPGMPQNDEELAELFRRFFGMPMPQLPTPNPGPDRNPSPKGKGQGKKPAPDREMPRGVGSGFIFSADGYVLTNSHVVEGASEIYVTLTDKREFKGKVIGSDKRTDVALVKIDATGLPKIAIGESKNIRVGQWVLAIGSPFGLENTVTVGIVSAKSRDTGDYLPLIQTDVAVNPGNSGGPLINMKGEVIGINNQILSESGGSIGISFAIPIDEVMHGIDQLKTSGKITRGRLGVQIGDVSKEESDAINLPKKGAMVRRVEPGAPAEKAGVQAGDIVLKFDGKAIEKASDLPRIVGDAKPGSKATLQVWRKGSVRDLSIVVGEMDPDTKAATREDQPGSKPAPVNDLGLAVSDLTADKRKELGISGGVLIESTDGISEEAGLRPGDIILALNNVDVSSARQFNDLVAKLDSKKPAFVLVRRGETVRYLALRSGK